MIKRIRLDYERLDKDKLRLHEESAIQTAQEMIDFEAKLSEE